MNASRKILSGMLYMVSGTYLGRLYGFVVSALVLPRFLDAQTLGEVALGASLFLVLINMKELGLSFSLLHHQERIDELAPTHFLMNFLVSAVWIGLIVFAFLVVRDLSLTLAFLPQFFSSQNSASTQLTSYALVCFSCFNLLKSASYTSETRLRARFEFKSLALVHMVGLLLALSVAVFLAWKGFGGWALIVGGAAHYVTYTPVYVLFTVSLIWYFQPQNIRQLRWNREHALLLWQYGKWFWGGGILYYVVLEAPKIIAGYVLGSEVLGFFFIAFVWAQLTTGAITHILMGLTNPVYARYQQDRQRLSLVFDKMVRFIVRIVLLLGAIFFLEADRLIALSGSQWGYSAQLLRLLVLYALFRPFFEDIQSLLLAVGVPRTLAKINAFQAVCTLLLCGLFCLLWGIEGIVLGLGITAALGTAAAFFVVRRYVDVHWRGILFKPILSIALTVVVVRYLETLLPQAGVLSLFVHLCLETAIYGAGLFFLERKEFYQDYLTLKDILRRD